mgnify:CR=1 FL=1
MKRILVLAATVFPLMVLLHGPAAADVKKGEKNFKRCIACHTLKQGRNKVGPSLHNIFGSKAGMVPKFRYSKGLKAASEKGLVWTRENLMEYLKDPKAFIRKFTGDKKARNKMLQKYKKEDFRKNVIDYLESKKVDSAKEG